MNNLLCISPVPFEVGSRRLSDSPALYDVSLQAAEAAAERTMALSVLLAAELNRVSS